MPRGAARSRAFLAIFAFVAIVFAVTAGVEAFSGGVTRELAKKGGATTELTQGGCSCHSAVPLDEIEITLAGVPGQYSTAEGTYEQKTYPLQLTWTGGPPPNPDPSKNHGGFSIVATGGKFLPPETSPEKDWVRASKDGLEITHTAAGELQTVRNFTFLWQSPAAAAGPISFIVTVNSVNGNGVADPEDRWDQAIFTTNDGHFATPVEAALVGGGAHDKPVHKIGVHYLAYWVGVISFAVLFIVYGATFLLFKYGETNYTTDHKDRSGASAPQGILAKPAVVPVITIVLSTAAILVILWATGHLGA